jgi:hypothetical protein
MITDYDAATYAQTAQGFRHVLRIREISGTDYNRKVAPRGDGRRGNDLRARRRNQCNRQLDYILYTLKSIAPTHRDYRKTNSGTGVLLR